MTFRVARATRRTFYLERTGATYTVVKVWEAGAVFDPADVAALTQRVFATAPDERIIAEQSFSLDLTGSNRVMTADLATVRELLMPPAEDPHAP